MCQAMLDNGSFDPALCPLLKGLSPQEIAERLHQQPIISCRQRLAAKAQGRLPPEDDHCPALLEEVAAPSR
jgi:hypothetical protein